jgi:transcriptional regulator CtsR
MLRAVVDDGISPQEAIDFVDRLSETKVITRREVQLMKAALRHDARQAEEDSLRRLRAAMLARMLEALLQES